MGKYIPYEKLSKKEKRKLDLAARGTWKGLDPVTRRTKNAKVYNRKRTQDWKKGLPDPVSFFVAVQGTCLGRTDIADTVCMFIIPDGRRNGAEKPLPGGGKRFWCFL